MATAPGLGLFQPSLRRRLAARLAQYRPAVPVALASRPRSTSRSPIVARLLAPVDKVLGIDRSTAAGENLAVMPALVAGAAAAAAVFVVLEKLLGLTGGTSALCGAAAAATAARMWAGSRRDAVLGRMEEQFALALGVIIRCVRAGLPVVEGMRAVAAEVTAPTGAEFRRCVDQVQLGVDFDAALAALADRCVLADYRFFGTTVILQRQTGGNLAETLDSLSETIRKRRAVRQKAQALTSETRATVMVLALLPLGVAAAMMVVSPDYILQLFTTERGRRLLGIAMVVQAFGLFIIRIITKRTLS
jgi:tight adherence protein B